MTTRRVSRRPRKGKANWAELAKIPEKEIESAAREDPDAQPLTDAQIADFRRVPDPKRIRESLGMTQKAFAAAFDLPLGTLRDWEQGRYHPDQASKNFLLILAMEPDRVMTLMSRSRTPATSTGASGEPSARLAIRKLKLEDVVRVGKVKIRSVSPRKRGTRRSSTPKRSK